MTVNRIIQEVKNIILKYARPERIYLFGSRVNGEATETSDIDIAYDDANLKDDSIIQKEVKALDTLIKVDVYLDMVVKRFEFTYEMSWKALKRYLGYSGIATDSPRMAFREGFSQGMIADESVWLDMIEQRNISSHVYDEYQVKGIIEKKEKYRDAFKALKEKIEAALKESMSKEERDKV